VSQLEATLQQVEQIRDTNARLLDRVMGELEVEQERSHSLLLNVLPQPIIDRLNAGEQLIADRYGEGLDASVLPARAQERTRRAVSE
jgi:hypothetical protein